MGTAPGTCTGMGGFTAGTLSSGQYVRTYADDAPGWLTIGVPGTHSYGDSAHLHAITAIGTNRYTASYEAGGDMTCRAPSGSQTCSGTPTGQALSYHNEGG